MNYKNTIEQYVNIFVNYLFNKETSKKFEFYNTSNKNEEYSHNFKNFISNAFNYVLTYYPEKIKNRENVLSNKILSNCVNDLENLYKIIESDKKIDSLKNENEELKNKNKELEDIIEKFKSNSKVIEVL